MMGDYTRFERPDDGLDDDEYPDENGLDDETSETLPCPECGAEIYEDTVRCPACGAYVAFDSCSWSGRPRWWIVLGVVAAVIAVLILVLAPPW